MPNQNCHEMTHLHIIEIGKFNPFNSLSFSDNSGCSIKSIFVFTNKSAFDFKSSILNASLASTIITLFGESSLVFVKICEDCFY